MQASTLHRAFSFCLAAMLTVAVLGSIDHLAQPTAVDHQMAQSVQPRA